MHHNTICLESQVLSILPASWCAPQRNSTTSENCRPWPRQKEDHRGVWSAAVDDEVVGCRGCAGKATCCRAVLGDHAARMACLCLVSRVFCPHLDMCMICSFVCWSSEKIRRVFLPICLLLASVQTHHPWPFWLRFRPVRFPVARAETQERHGKRC